MSRIQRGINENRDYLGLEVTKKKTLKQLLLLITAYFTETHLKVQINIWRNL